MSEEASAPITRVVKVVGVDTKSGGEDTDRPWTKYALVDEKGNKQSTFDKKTGMFLQSSIGRYVEIELEKSGKYWNLLSAKPADGPAPSAVSPKTNGNGNGRDPETEMHIAREAALKAICQLHEGTGADLGSILHLADRAVKWIYGADIEAALANAKISPPTVVMPPLPSSAARPEVVGDPEPLRIITRVRDITYKALDDGRKRFQVHTEGDETYYTFSETLAKTLKAAKDKGRLASIAYLSTEYGLEVVEVATAPDDGVIQGQPVTVPS